MRKIILGDVYVTEKLEGLCRLDRRRGGCGGAVRTAQPRGDATVWSDGDPAATVAADVGVSGGLGDLVRLDGDQCSPDLVDRAFKGA